MRSVCISDRSELLLYFYDNATRHKKGVLVQHLEFNILEF